jgi:sn-glycerol 3-phosphate transport system permease protein
MARVDAVGGSAVLIRTERLNRIGRLVLPYLLILPTFLLIFGFTLWPTVSAVVQSTYMPGVTVKIPARFVGLDNYRALFDPDTDVGQTFPRVFLNTIIYVGVTVPVSIALAFALALLLNRPLRGIGLFRFAFFYPVLMPLIGAASVFKFLFADNIGLINTVLHSLGVQATPVWVGDPNNALIVVMIVAIWKQTGFYMIIFLAGLQSLPKDVYEAANLDGANMLDQVRFLTLPLLSGTTVFVVTIAVTMAFQMVDQLYALGEGGPADRSNLLLYFIFQKYNELRNAGIVNAVTVILLVLLLVFTLLNLRFGERTAYYEN